MNTRKFFICFFAFIILTAIKFIFPEENLEFGNKIRTILNSDTDFAETAEAIGRSLSGGTLREELMEVLGFSEDDTRAANTEKNEENPAEDSIRTIKLGEGRPE